MGWPYPVLFLEHKLLYGERQDRGVYRELATQQGDVAAHLFPTLARGDRDTDLTMVTYGGMLPVAESVAGRLESEEELSVEMVVPSLLAPLPKNTLIDHLLTRKRVAVVEESHGDFGVGAEIGASLLDRGFKGQFLRVGAPPVPIAAARSLERQILPDEEQLVRKILDWLL
jgi:2-oxoisovalerate dehydrogenase E1 component